LAFGLSHRNEARAKDERESEGERELFILRREANIHCEITFVPACSAVPACSIKTSERQFKHQKMPLSFPESTAKTVTLSST
jgi:hypothetical protein